MKEDGIIRIKPLGFQWETNDPFLFCVHHEDFFPEGKENFGPDPKELNGRNIGQDFQIKDGWRMYHGDKIPGFPHHPHRGFETVTVVQRGYVDHSDSLGASGRYGMGDTQWMTAGKGVQHSEMFPLLNLEQDNTMELFQIWLNLPAKNKMVDPHFTMLWKENTPIIKKNFDNGNSVKITLVAGELDSINPPSPPPNSWASNPENSIAIWIIEMDPQTKWTLPPTKSGVNRTLYYFKGEDLTMNEVIIPNYHGVELDPEKKIDLVNKKSFSKLLLLQGKPIDEPVAQYGPFVMNNMYEIQMAFADYQKSQFGGWPWDSSEPVHNNKGRFAKYPDGKEEIPEG